MNAPQIPSPPPGVFNTETRAVPVEVTEALHTEYRIELGKMQMQLILYREALEQAGIEPPDRSGEELLSMWRRCRGVISTASEFVASLGSAAELLA